MCKCDPTETGASADTFLSSMFNECIYHQTEYVSFVFGTISLFLWIIANYPAVRKAFLIKDIEAMSPAFLALWLIGDSLSFISVIIMKVLFTQQILAAYFVVMDILMITEMIVYGMRKKKLIKKSENVDESELTEEARYFLGKMSGYESSKYVERKSKFRASEIVVYCMLFVILLSHLLWAGFYGSFQLTHTPDVKSTFTATCADGSISKPVYIAGSVLAYISIPCYVGARPGQIVQTCKTKRPEGLAVAMFIIAMLANLTQGISIVVSSSDKDYLVGQVPYILAAWLPVLLDSVIIGQYFYYMKKIKASGTEEEANAAAAAASLEAEQSEKHAPIAIAV